MGLLQTPCFLLEGMTYYRFKGQTAGLHNADLTYRFLLGFENINCSFKSENCLALGVAGKFFFNFLASKRDGQGKTSEVVSIWRKEI